MSLKRQKAELDDMKKRISSWSKIHGDYPEGGYGKNVKAILEERRERAEKIGRKKK